MKKILFVFLLSLAAAGSSFAQKTYEPLAQGTFALPIGDLKDECKNGYGGTLSIQGNVLDNLDISLSLGYIDFKQKADESLHTKYYPILIGARASKSFGRVEPYASLQLGFLEVNEQGKNFNLIDSTSETASHTSAKYLVAPGVGLKASIFAGLSFDLNAKFYHAFVKGWSRDFLGLNAGFSYRL